MKVELVAYPLDRVDDTTTIQVRCIKCFRMCKAPKSGDIINFSMEYKGRSVPICRICAGEGHQSPDVIPHWLGRIQATPDRVMTKFIETLQQLEEAAKTGVVPGADCGVCTLHVPLSDTQLGRFEHDGTFTVYHMGCETLIGDNPCGQCGKWRIKCGECKGKLTAAYIKANQLSGEFYHRPTKEFVAFFFGNEIARVPESKMKDPRFDLEQIEQIRQVRGYE